MLVTARQLCQILDGELEGNPDVSVNRPSKIEEADEGSLSFLANPKYEHFAYQTKASILLVGKDFEPSQPIATTLIRVTDVYQSLGKLLNAFNETDQPDKGVSDLAYVHPDAKIGNDVAIAAFAYISEGAEIGDGVVIYPQVFVGRGVKIGSATRIFPGVKVYHDCILGSQCVVHGNSVIGSDGFGFAQAGNGEYSKIAQVGNVVIEDKVEIGANTVIDRATMGSTVVRSGVKLDNLIQIAHNVDIGDNTVIAAQAGIAGSTKIGKNVRIGGQAGFVGHIDIADGVQVQAQSGVASPVDQPGERLYGSPAIKYIDYLKAYTIFRKLPELQKQVRDLQNQLEEMKRKSDQNP